MDGILAIHAIKQQNQIDELKKKLERCEEALKFYASYLNYKSYSVEDPEIQTIPDVIYDGGKRAKQALEQEC